jgi:hypothetical protein
VPDSVQSVIVHKTVLLQRLADFIRMGYDSWVAGYCEPSAAAGLARKFARYYATDLDRHRRCRARKLGEASAVLLMHELNGQGRLLFVLLLTCGTHPARQLEARLQSALDPAHRLVVDQFELVRLTRKGSDKPVYTWRLEKSAYKNIRSRVIDTVRRGSERDIRQLIVSLYRTPGFSGVRSQIGKCCQLFRNEWKRVRKGPCPAFPPKLFYVSRLPVVSVPLSVWLSAQSRRASDLKSVISTRIAGTSTSGSG